MHSFRNVLDSDRIHVVDTSLTKLRPTGGLPTSRREEGKTNRLVKRGIILHSSDSGEHWAVVYRNPQLGAFNALATNGSGCVWAVGKNSQIIRLCPSDK
jgi:hypothetical protein